jgi:hypothetical protein
MVAVRSPPIALGVLRPSPSASGTCDAICGALPTTDSLGDVRNTRSCTVFGRQRHSVHSRRKHSPIVPTSSDRELIAGGRTLWLARRRPRVRVPSIPPTSASNSAHREATSRCCGLSSHLTRSVALRTSFLACHRDCHPRILPPACHPTPFSRGRISHHAGPSVASCCLPGRLQRHHRPSRKWNDFGRVSAS